MLVYIFECTDSDVLCSGFVDVPWIARSTYIHTLYVHTIMPDKQKEAIQDQILDGTRYSVFFFN